MVNDTENQNSKTGVNVRVEEQYHVPRKNIKKIEEQSSLLLLWIKVDNEIL